MEVPRSPALRLGGCYVLGGRVALSFQIAAEPLNESVEVLIEPLGVSHVGLIGKCYPQGRFRFRQVTIDDVPEIAEALGYTGLVLGSAGGVLEQFYNACAEVYILVGVQLLYGDLRGAVDAVAYLYDIAADLHGDGGFWGWTLVFYPLYLHGFSRPCGPMFINNQVNAERPRWGRSRAGAFACASPPPVVACGGSLFRLTSEAVIDHTV